MVSLWGFVRGDRQREARAARLGSGGWTVRVIAWCAAAALGCSIPLLSAGAATGAGHGLTAGVTAPTPGPSGGGSVVVTVPPVPYTPVADSFLVGRYRSRLHVLHNDTGFPAAPTLTLVNARGAVVRTLSLPRVGTVTVDAGMVLLTPLRGATDATAAFRYAAASANGQVQTQRALVRLRSPAISVRDDVVQPVGSEPTTVDVAANDVVLVPGAVRRCAPDLFAVAPAAVDPRQVVLPDPERPEGGCPQPTPLTTPDGTWEMAGGALTFTAAAPFDGHATIYYRQATDFPFDVGVARVVVRSGGPGAGPGGPGGGPGGGSTGGPGGQPDGSGTPGGRPGTHGGQDPGLLGSLGDVLTGGVALPAAPAMQAPPVPPAPAVGSTPPQSARGAVVAAPETTRTVDAVSAWFMAWPVLPALVLLVVAGGRRWWRHRAPARIPR